MAEKLRFELVSPERLVLSEEVEMVVVPGTAGNFGALPRHAPFLSMIRPGVIEIYNARQVTERLFVAGGYAEVTPERCTVLAEAAMPVGEIDRDKIEAELKDLREDFEDAIDDSVKKSLAAKIATAEAKLKVAAG